MKSTKEWRQYLNDDHTSETEEEAVVNLVEAVREEFRLKCVALLRKLGVETFHRINKDAFDRAYGESAAYHHSADLVENFGKDAK